MVSLDQHLLYSILLLTYIYSVCIHTHIVYAYPLYPLYHSFLCIWFISCHWWLKLDPKYGISSSFLLWAGEGGRALAKDQWIQLILNNKWKWIDLLHHAKYEYLKKSSLTRPVFVCMASSCLLLLRCLLVRSVKRIGLIGTKLAKKQKLKFILQMYTPPTLMYLCTKLEPRQLIWK